MATRRRPATAADLLGKASRTADVVLTIPGEKGDAEVVLKLTALSAASYDALLAKFPPTKEQKDEGNGYDPEKFCPALIAAVVTDPALTVEQATEIWTSESWNRGELRDLFPSCVNLCSQGLDIPFT